MSDRMGQFSHLAGELPKVVGEGLCRWVEDVHKKQTGLVMKMRTFHVSSETMTLFYRSFIESVLTFCIVAWFGNLNWSNKNRLRSLVKSAGCQEVSRPGSDRSWGRLDCSSQPLQNQFELLPSGCCFRAPMRRIKRLQVSFIPIAIHLLNGN